MSDRKKGISHDTAAQLIGISPGELESLVTTGLIRRNDRNDYAVQIVVQDYIEHIRTAGMRIETSPTQAEIATHLGVSDRTVRELLTKWGENQNALTLTEIRHRYITGLREVAAGRATNGDIELATERALLARAQREKVEMANAVTRRELAPVSVIAEVLARVGRQIASILEALPPAIKRRALSLTPDDLLEIEREIVKARNLAASIKLDLSDFEGGVDGSLGDSPCDQDRPDSA